MNKNKLLRDKYISLFFGISNTTLISYKKDDKLIYRYKAFKSYYTNLINKLSDKDTLIYINDINLFIEELKNLTILNKFTIL